MKNTKQIKSQLKNQKYLLSIQNPNYKDDIAYHEGIVEALTWVLAKKPIDNWDGIKIT